ncbi:multiple C2 and transmembrane domain-containing protein 1-like [Stigmatopora nigra]
MTAAKQMSMWRSLHNLKDVGVVQVKVIRAEGLMAADVNDATATLEPSTHEHPILLVEHRERQVDKQPECEKGAFEHSPIIEMCFDCYCHWQGWVSSLFELRGVAMIEMINENECVTENNAALHPVLAETSQIASFGDHEMSFLSSGGAMETYLGGNDQQSKSSTLVASLDHQNLPSHSCIFLFFSCLGKSDPFCIVELSNDRLQTHTVYKNLNPEWNKVFTFNVKDIHSVLEVTVYDEDRDRSADFLGKVAIPLLSIQNGERKAYVLKSKELTGPTKGVIFLEIDVIFNAVKAGLRTLIPIEQKYMEEEPRVSKQLLLRNFNRVRRCITFLINTGCYINSCFEWESPQRSICAFVLFVILVWNFELYMIPLALLLPLAWNYILITSGKDTRQDVQAMEDLMEDEDEDFDKDDRDSERKGFMNKLYAIQDVCISVQNALDEVASYGERIKNTFNWTVPFLSWLAMVALGMATLIVYFIPLRYIVLAWGVNKFTKKLRDPYAIDNNEILDFLSRVPSDVQVVQYRELKQDPNPSPNKRKKNNPG